jgi:riboflavin biosynthesis pyrimidine reductase
MTDDAVLRLWPDPGAPALDDAGILTAYAMPDRPAVRVNFVESADGAATVDGKSGGLGGAADHRIFGLLRVACDAVMVGAGTLRDEGYGPMVLDAAHQALRRDARRMPQPTLVIVSNSLNVDPAHPMFADAPVRPWVLTHAGAPADRRAKLATVASVLVDGESAVDCVAALGELAAAGLRHVLCEGGPHLFGALAAANAVDEMCLTIAPSLAGAGAGRIIAGPPAALTELDLAHVLKADDGELFLRYRRRD